MIDQLFDEERPCVDPVYKETTAQINNLWQQLRGRLDEDSQSLLDQLELLYIRQSGAELRDAFAEGFSTAVKLLLEAMRR